ncbi:ATP-binding protein [Halovivax gelatinilyticus]|uniref:ATP-binding protein n=1 Tax=Halovivax gelatinilyticus TaxID=2961597 RepID=UPI0020CA7002|nr:ATP-binding protein [Halovivax gelatinilyticus]
MTSDEFDDENLESATMTVTSTRTESLRTGAVITGFGLALALIHTVHLVHHAHKPVLATVSGALIPLALSLGVIYSGHWLATTSRLSTFARRITLWTIASAAVLGVTAGLIVVHQLLAGHHIGDAPYIVATAGTAGALGGFFIGIYDAHNRRKARQIETIHETSTALMNHRTRESVCEHVVRVAYDGLDLSLVGIWLYDEDDHALVPVSNRHPSTVTFEEYPTYEPGNSLSWEVFETKSVLETSNVADEQAVYNPETPIRSEIIVPLDDHGVFNVGSLHTDAFDRIDRTTIRVLAASTIAALDRAEREETLRRQRAELRSRTAHLKSFNRTVSHDLRNPLTIAAGRLDMAKETGDLVHLDEASDAIDRMEAIIEDLLWLSQEGEQIGEKRAVSLDTIAEAGWRFVETGDATLRVNADRPVCADEDRLQQLFENLFRNAIEHGGPDVTVTVGERDDGFYVEDTGPGIPPEKRAEVFEAGHTTAPNGTGFGLAIVDTIVDAHGWTVEITSGTEGGARFEITGIERVEPTCCQPLTAEDAS